MTEPVKRSRWKHFRASLSRQSRGRSKDSIAIVALALAGVAMTLFIFTQQKASLPAWAPFVGEEFVHITGEFETAQAIAPGQGQAVDIAGIQVGKISSVALEDGHAVVGMDIEPKYMELIHPDATLLMRPKTNLDDMVVEITPGTAPGHLEAGDNIPLAQTKSNTSLDGFLATLDADTRQYIQLLLAGGAQGVGSGHQLSGVFRHFRPFVRYTAELNKAVAQRRVALARVIHDFSTLTTELGRRDTDIERFVSGSNGALGAFANQQQALQESLVEFPATLSAAEAGLASSNELSVAARPALIGLIPQAEALGPAFKATERFFGQTTVPIRDQIRPFTRQVRPILTHTKQASPDLQKTVAGFGNSLGALNSFFNELAYKPSGSRQSYLFYLPWLNHDLNATYNLQDARRPDPARPDHAHLHRRPARLRPCQPAAPPAPYINALLNGAHLPRTDQLPTDPGNARRPRRGMRAANMSKRAPSTTQLLVIAGFALSCFGILLFLWITFGGPTPFKAKSYEIKIPFDEAAQLAQQSDVRISGVNVGKVQNIERNPGKLAIATIDIDDQYAPLPRDTRALLRTKTLLAETYVELTTGNRNGPKLEDGETLPEANVAQSVQIDEIFRTFNPQTRAAFQEWMQNVAIAIQGRGLGLLQRPRRTRHHLHRIRQTLPGPRHPEARRAPALQQRRRRAQRLPRPRRPARRPDPERERSLPDHRQAGHGHRSAVPRLPDLRGPVPPDHSAAQNVRRSTPIRWCASWCRPPNSSRRRWSPSASSPPKPRASSKASAP